MEAWIVQIIVSLVGTISAMAVGFTILAKKMNGAPQSNGQKKIDYSLQRQIDTGDENAKSLSSQFYDQVKDCNSRWIEVAESRGEIRAFMSEIRDRLIRLEKEGR